MFTFKAIGTSWTITIADTLTEAGRKDTLDAIHKRIAEFDRAYSRFRDDSIVAEMSRNAGEYVLPEDATRMFEVYEKMYKATNGLMTPLMGKVLSDAGYDKTYSLQPKERISPAPKWDDSVVFKAGKLTISKPVHFDFGAAGKGYLIDIIANLLKDRGLKEYVVNAGGDIAQKSENGTALVVALENPENTNQGIGTVPILNKSICGSAGNRRTWAKYTHIINPETGESPREILAIWAVADETIVADALTTALFFVEPEQLTEIFNFEYVIVYADHSARISPGFPGHLF